MIELEHIEFDATLELLLERQAANQLDEEDEEEEASGGGQDARKFAGSISSSAPLGQRLKRPLRQCLHACNRRILAYLAKFHRMDLHARRPLQDRLSYGAKLRRYASRTLSSNAASNQSVLLATWPNLLLLAWAAYAATLLVYLCHQLAYDFWKLRLRQFNVHLSDTQARRQLIKRHEPLAFQGRAQAWIGRLHGLIKLIGAPHVQWSIVVENITAYTLLASYIAYVLGPFWYNLQDAVQYPMVRYFLDQPGEIRHRARTIRLELNRLVASSENFTKSLVDRLVTSAGDFVATSEPHERAHGLVSRARLPQKVRVNIKLAIKRHLLTVAQLRALATRGRLGLLTRDSRWLDQCALFSISLFVFIFVYCPIWIVWLYLMADEFFSSLGRPAEFNTWRDINTFLGSALLLFIILNSAAFYGIVNSLNVIDQLRAVNELRQLIRKQLSHNERRAHRLLRIFNQYQQAGGGQLDWPAGARLLSNGRRQSLQLVGLCQVNRRAESELGAEIQSLVEQINSDMLAAIMQYRLFYEQFKKVKRTFDAYAIGCIISVTSLPIITRILLPYIDVQLKTFAFGLSIAGLLPTFVALTPLCHLNSRCLETYGTLWSLLAQLTQFQVERVLSESLNFEHLLSLLRKELADPENFAYKFAASTAVANVTYGNMLKIIFWMSLILTSLFGERIDDDNNNNNKNNYNNGDLFSNFLKDPFGITSF